jgi:hypothetical protein
MVSVAQKYQTTLELIPVTREQIHLPDFRVIFDIWDNTRRDRFAPSWPEIDLMEFPLQQLPRCVVVDCDPFSDDFTYRFWGTKVTDLHNQDLTGQRVRDLKPPEIAEILQKQYIKSYEAKVPTLFINHVTTAIGTSAEEITLRLPLSADGENLTHFVCAFDFGEDIDAYRKAIEEFLY